MKVGSGTTQSSGQLSSPSELGSSPSSTGTEYKTEKDRPCVTHVQDKRVLALAHALKDMRWSVNQTCNLETSVRLTF